MPDGRTITRRAALGSIAVGATFILHNTYSFSSTRADRTSNVNTTEDGSALLGVEGTAADTTPAFSKNVDSDMTVSLTAPYEPSAEFDVGPDGNWSASASFTITDSNPIEVEMRADVQDITVAITGDFADGTVEMERVFQIPQAGQVDITATVKSAGNSGKFEFGLANEGSIDAVMTAIRVDGTTANATQVRKDDIFSIVEGTADEPPRQLISSPLQIGSGQPLTQFDNDGSGNPDSVLLSANQNDQQSGPEVVFEFNRFQDDSNNNAKMKGESVTITVEFEDGSSRQYTLQDT